jgi:hypothetical protein
LDSPEFYPHSDTGRPGAFEILARGVVLDGFTIKHYDSYSRPSHFADRDRIWPNANNITIRNCVIERGITPAQVSDLTISNNWFTGLPVGSNAAAIQVNGATNLEITDNMFTDPYKCNKAINLQGGNTSYVDTVIARNQMGPSPWTGIEIQGVRTQYTNLRIEDNIIKDIGPGLSNVETAGIRLWGQSSFGDATIRNNLIYNSAIGVKLERDMSNVTIVDNCFESNEVQVLDKGAVSLDLEKVLGDNVFPEGSMVIGNEIKVFVPDEGKVYNKNTGAEYDTIQTAVNGATEGDTILVGPGEYEDNLLIDKYILLIGDSNGQTKLKPKADEPVIKLAASGQSHENPLLLKDIDIYTSNVGGHDYGKMTGIMIEGDDTSIAHIRLENIAIVGNNHSYTGSTFEYGLHVRLGVDLSDLVITGSSFSKLSYGMFVGQVKSDDPGSLDEVEICDTVFESNSNKGMYVEKLSNATLTDVSFINNGTLDLIEDDWARPYLAGLDINLKYGTYENIALNNLTVVYNGLKAKDGVGVAIKARDDGSYNTNAATLRNVVINGGVFRSNERGLRFGEPGKDNLGPTKVTIRNVAFMGETPQYEGVDGSRYGALVNETLATIDAAGNYWGHESGPYHSLSNPDGQGDSVSDGVVFFPWYVDEGMS